MAMTLDNLTSRGLKPRFPLPEADVPAQRGECLARRLGHDHD